MADPFAAPGVGSGVTPALFGTAAFNPNTTDVGRPESVNYDYFGPSGNWYYLVLPATMALALGWFLLIFVLPISGGLRLALFFGGPVVAIAAWALIASRRKAARLKASRSHRRF